MIEVNCGGFFIPKRHRPTLFTLTKLKWKTNIKHHSQADDLRDRFKVPKWGVFCHTERLRDHPARLKLVLSDSAPTPRSCKRSSTLRSESGKRTYSITAKRMISGLVLKYLNGECFVIRRGYETARPVSSKFNQILQTILVGWTF